MKSSILCVLAFLAGAVSADTLTLPPAELHPQIGAILKQYPPLGKGGFRIEELDDSRYLVIGIGKAPLKNGFSQAVRGAELDAEAQIAKALNPTEINVETTRSQSAASRSDGSTERHSVRKKFIKMLVSSHTPFITSCGMWTTGTTLYCARAVFVGDFDHRASEGKLSAGVTDFSILKAPPADLELLPYLARGGTILLKQEANTFLISAVFVPEKLPSSKKLTFARNQAYKNMIAFISGGKLEHQLVSISKSIASDRDGDSVRRIKRKNLEKTIQGEFQFIEPFARWRTKEFPYEFFLYCVKVDMD